MTGVAEFEKKYYLCRRNGLAFTTSLTEIMARITDDFLGIEGQVGGLTTFVRHGKKYVRKATEEAILAAAKSYGGFT